MLAAFQQQLSQHFPAQRDFLIGLSGGVDSVVLLSLFAQTDCRLRAIHIHHGLSPNADDWAEFCQKLCDSLKIPLRICRVAVDNRQNVEANARAARYRAIGAHIQANEVFAAAHHLDDQAETILLALKRGSGVQGLGAMQAVGLRENFAIFRPLLPFSKAEILDYAKAHNLQWKEDESNQNCAYDRNFLRQAVLPLLNQRWQQFNRMAARSARHCTEQQRLIEELLQEELAARIDSNKLSLDIQGFEQFSAPKRNQLIRLWLTKCALPMPSVAQLEQIVQLIFAATDKTPQVKVADKLIRRYRQRLFVTEQYAPTADFYAELRAPKAGESVSVALPCKLGVIERREDLLICKISARSHRLHLPEALRQSLLTVKLHHSGKVKCFGKSQREEMKKIWQAHQVPVWERTRTPLIFFEDQLVAVISG